MAADPADFASGNGCFTRFGDWYRNPLTLLVPRSHAVEVAPLFRLSDRKDRLHEFDNFHPEHFDRHSRLGIACGPPERQPPACYC